MKVIFEPGRLIAGNAGILVSEVIFVKEGDAKNFVIVDAAMNDLIRPTLYEAYHEVRPVVQGPPAARIRADIVGPVCETGDFLALDRDMARLGQRPHCGGNSRRLWRGAGESTCNTRLLVPEVLVDGDRFHVVRPRPSYDDLIGLDSMPEWLGRRSIFRYRRRDGYYPTTKSYLPNAPSGAAVSFNNSTGSKMLSPSFSASLGK